MDGIWPGRILSGKNGKKLFFALLLILFPGLLWGLDVRVGYFNKEPLIFQNSKGDTVGLAVDILEDIADRENWRIDFVSGNFSEILNQLRNGQVDLMASVGYTPERDEFLDYSGETLLETWACLFVPTAGEIKSIPDVDGKTIGYVRSSMFRESFLQLVNDFDLSCTMTEVENYPQLFNDIIEGRLDGGIGDRLFFVSLSHDKSRRIDASIVFHPFGMYFAVPEGDPLQLLGRINTYLNTGKSTAGSPYTAHLDRWFSRSDGNTGTSLIVLYPVLSLLFLFSLIYLATRYTGLRRILGFSEIVESQAARNVVLASLALSILLWNLDTVTAYFWFNEKGRTFRQTLFSLQDTKELIERFMFVVPILLGGVILSGVFQHLCRIQELTRKSKEHLQITLNSIGDAVISTDTEGRVLNMNPVAEKLTSWSHEEAKGIHLSEVFNIINARTLEPAENPVLKVLERGRIIGLANHTKLISRDGEEYHISDSAAPIMDGHGNTWGVVLVFRDMTEEYTLQEKLDRLRNYLSSIIDSMPSMIIGVDTAGLVTQWNLEAAGITNIKADGAIGQKLEMVLPSFSGYMEDIREAISEKKTRVFTRQPSRENGSLIYRDITIYPLLEEGTEGAILRIDDVTEHVRLEEIMVQNEKMLSVGGLAAGMAHEINNPLAGMIQNSEVLRNRLTGDIEANHTAAKEAGTTMEAIRRFMELRKIPLMLERIRESGSRAAEIVRNMLSFARKSESSRSSHDMSKLLEKSVDLASNDYNLKKHFDFRSIKILREYEADLPPIPCEPGKMQQVFLNILRNGAEAMAEKSYGNGPDISDKEEKRTPRFVLRVKAERNARQVKRIRVEIEDNGPGMPEEVRKRVFEPFFTTKATDRGTGLGMSVSYFIITENHGGEMYVESEPGEGSRFIIILPL